VRSEHLDSAGAVSDRLQTTPDRVNIPDVGYGKERQD